MSHSPEKAANQEVVDDDYVYGWLALSQLLAEGGSLSGRERNCCYLNTPSGRFANISAVSGLDFPDDGRAIGVVDWDQDGQLDLWLANRTGPRLRLMRNTSQASKHFIAFRLVGRQCNRDAIGARVELYRTAESQRPEAARSLRASEGFLGQSSKWVHFGLGNDATLERVVVRWPGGDPETFGPLVAGRRYQLTQGTGQATPWQKRRATPVLAASSVPQSPRTQAARIVLAGRLAMPAMTYRSGVGRELAVPVGNQPLLINLWATWCLPCLKELGEFADHHRELESLGLKSLALCVDQTPDDGNPTQVLQRLHWPFLSGHATSELLETLDIVQRITTSERKPMPVPTSFLLDRQGQLAVIYKGSVSADQLLADVQRLDNSTPTETLGAGLPFAGRWLRAPRPGLITTNELMFEFMNAGYTPIAEKYLTNLSQAGDATQRDNQSFAIMHLNLGARHLGKGNRQAALKSFRAALRFDDSLTKAHLGLARGLMQQHQAAEAMPHFLAVVRADPSHAESHFELGRLFADKGQGAAAVQHLQAALDARPDWIAPLNVLARILALHPDPQLRDVDRALKLATQAIALTGRRDPQTLETLSLAHAVKGQFALAISVGEEALARTPPEKQPRTAGLRKRLDDWRRKLEQPQK